MTSTVYELTEAEAWKQIDAWLKAGHRIVWDKRYLSYWTLYLTPKGEPFPLEVRSSDRDEYRVIDCVLRMRRLLAARDAQGK